GLLAPVLVPARHRSNLVRWRRGTETRVADSPRLRMAARVLHVLALSLWFGGGVFFSIVTLQLFSTMTRLAENPPEWLPLRTEGATEQGPGQGHVPFGTRLAGATVGPRVPVY